MILGLDVSTSISGYTLMNGDKIVLNGAWDTRKYKDFFEKVYDNLFTSSHGNLNIGL